MAEGGGEGGAPVAGGSQFPTRNQSTKTISTTRATRIPVDSRVASGGSEGWNTCGLAQLPWRRVLLEHEVNRRRRHSCSHTILVAVVLARATVLQYSTSTTNVVVLPSAVERTDGKNTMQCPGCRRWVAPSMPAPARAPPPGRTAGRSRAISSSVAGSTRHRITVASKALFKETMWSRLTPIAPC